MAASSPPSGCPMHKALPTPAQSASPPSGCPMHKARPAKVDEVNPVRASTARIASLPAALPARAAQPTATLNLRRAVCFQANAMPTQPNQQPAMGQRAPLSTHRVNSNIPGPSEGLTLALTLTVTLTVALTVTVTITVTATATATLTPTRTRTRTRTRTLTLTLALPLTKATGSTRRSRCSSTRCAGRATVS